LNEKVKQIIVRAPEQIYKWLKENVTDMSVNDYIVNLIKKDIESKSAIKEKHTGWYFPEEVIPEMIRLLSVRKQILLTKDKSDWTFLAPFGRLEACFIESRADEVAKIIADCKSKVGEKVWSDYFEPAFKLIRRQQSIMYAEIMKSESISSA
jgi:hypothetical protein